MSAELPNEWKPVRIGSFARELSERNRTSERMPVLSMTKHRGFVRSNEYFSKSVHSDNTDNYKVVRRGQFAYATIHLEEGSIDYLRHYESGLISPMYTVFEISPDVVDREYLFRNLKRFALSGRFDSYSNGGVNRRKSISFNELKAFKFVMPLLYEQRAIAEILDTFEQAIAKTRVIIESIKHSRTEITYDFQGSENSGKWPIQAIGALLDKCQYGLSIPLDGEGSVPVLRMPDIDAGRINEDTTTLKFADVTPADVASCSIRKGDILFNRTNSQALVGKTGVIRNTPHLPIVFASYIIRLVVKPSVDPFWLNAVLNLPRTQERLKTLATPGVSQWNINSKVLKRFKIPVPPKVEQARFAELYEAIERRLEAERATLKKLEEVHAAFAQELLSGRLRLPESIISRHRDKPGQAA